MAAIMDSRHRFLKRWHVSDVKNIAGDNQTTLIVHQNSANITCTFSFYVFAIASVPQLTAAAVATHPHCRISKRWHVDVKNFTGDDQAKLHWRWPGNPNGRSKFCNLGLFTFTRSQLTLCRRLRGWWHIPEIAQTARKFMITGSRKTSCCYDVAAIDGIAHCFFSAIIRNSFCLTNNFSTTLTPTKKPRYTYCKVFCTFYL